MKDEIMMAAFKIIADAGDASSKFFQALKLAEANDFEASETIFEEANESLISAHNKQTELLCAEARGESTEYALIMVHAQDHLMNANLLKDIVSSFINLHKKIEEKGL